MIAMSKEELMMRSRRFISGFAETASKLGKHHPLVKVMGSLAWGRHGAECGPDGDTIRGRAMEYGYLRGCKDLLVRYCNHVNDDKARSVLLKAMENAKAN